MRRGLVAVTAALALCAATPVAAGTSGPSVPFPTPSSEPSSAAPEPSPAEDPAPTGAPSPSDAPTPADPPSSSAPPAAPPSPAGSACDRGQYGDVLRDGTVDVGCDGVLSFAEQRSPVTLRITTRARVGERVAVTIDERDVAGDVLRADARTARGGTVTRFPLLYVAPDGLDGQDQFSLWVLRDDYQREVRVVVRVERSTGAGAVDEPPRGALLGGADDGAVVDVARVDRGFGPAALVVPLAVVAVLLVLAALVWATLRREDGGDGPGVPVTSSRTSFTAGG